jgi:hypothetical protein
LGLDNCHIGGSGDFGLGDIWESFFVVAYPIGLFAGGAFFKAVTREYIKSRNEAMIRHEIASKHKAAKDSEE